MKNLFDLFKPTSPETSRLEDLPKGVREELYARGIDESLVKKIEIDTSIQHIDGRVFYTIKLPKKTIKLQYIGEGGYVQDFEVIEK